MDSARAELPDTKLRASDTFESQEFGTSVALRGNVALIGAPESGVPANGSAYVFRFDGSSWVEEQKLVAPDGSSGAAFGFSVSLGSESLALVGAYLDDGEGTDAGAAYVFRHDGISWLFEQKLVADAPVVGDRFGYATAMGPTTAAVGASMDGFDGISDAGSIFVFEFNGSTWDQVSNLRATDPARDDEFGISVALDGGRRAGGSWLDDDGGSGSGSAHVFDAGGALKLTAGDAAAFDAFGIDVGLAGNLLVVGASGDDDGGSEAGSAYVYQDSGSGFAFEQKLTSSDADGSEEFGRSVAVDGDLVVIGARLDDDFGFGINSGTVYVFRREGASWTQILEQHASDADGGDEYGYDVAIDGDRMLVGARFDDVPINAGAAYVIELSSLAPAPVPGLPWAGVAALAILLVGAGGWSAVTERR